MVYAGISDRMPQIFIISMELAINMQIFAVSEVSGGSYCNSNASCGT